MLDHRFVNRRDFHFDKIDANIFIQSLALGVVIHAGLNSSVLQRAKYRSDGAPVFSGFNFYRDEVSTMFKDQIYFEMSQTIIFSQKLIAFFD